MDITKGIPFTTDCCGKEDLDFNIISVDTRYWRDMTAMCTFRLLSNQDSERWLPDGTRADICNEGVDLLESGYISGNNKEETQQNVRNWINKNILKVMKMAIKKMEDGI